MKHARIIVPLTVVLVVLVSVCWGQTLRRVFEFPDVSGAIVTVPATSVDTAAIVDEAVTKAKMKDGDAIGDMLWFDGTDWQFFDANQPNNILRLNDSNQPAWSSEAVTTVNNIKNDIIYNIKLKKSGAFDDNDIITVDTASSGFTGHTLQEVIEAQFPTAGTDPDVDAAGEIGRDTDDHSLRGYDGSAQYVYGQKIRTIQFTIAQPDDLDETDDIPIWSNESGFSFEIIELKAWSDIDDATFTLVETSGTNWDSETTIEAVTISTDGTGCFYTTVAVGDIDATTIENGNMIVLDPSADDMQILKITIKGYFNGNVD